MQTVIDHLNKLSRDYTRRHGAFLCSTLKWHSCLRRPVSGRCKDHEDPAVGEGAAQPCDAANRQQVRAGPTAVAGAGVGLRGVAQQPPLQDGAAAFEAARWHSAEATVPDTDDRSSVPPLDVDRPRPAAAQPGGEHRGSA